MLVEVYLTIHNGLYFGQFYLFIPYKFQYLVCSLDNFSSVVRNKNKFSLFCSIDLLFVALLAKLLGFVIWVITFIDFYAGAPVGLRYFLCLFPNAGLLFCLQVILQYERKNCEFFFNHYSFIKTFYALKLVKVIGFGQLYSNLFTYPLYIGLCLLLMLIYSVNLFLIGNLC